MKSLQTTRFTVVEAETAGFAAKRLDWMAKDTCLLSLFFIYRCLVSLEFGHVSSKFERVLLRT